MKTCWRQLDLLHIDDELGTAVRRGKNTTVVEPRSGILARGGRERRKGRNSEPNGFFFLFCVLVFRYFREEPAADDHASGRAGGARREGAGL